MNFSVMTLPLLPMPNIPGLHDGAQEAPKEGVLLQLYQQLKEAGAESLDIASIDLQFGGEKAVLEALEATGLRCSCYLAFIAAPMPTEEGQQAAIAAGKDAIDLTLRLGAKVMMFVPAGNQEAIKVMSRQELSDKFIEVLRPVVAYGKEKDVTVVIEDAPHLDFPMCSEAELRYLLEGAPGLKLVYDSGNMCFAGEEPVAYYDHLAEYTAHGHAKDVVFQNGAWRETIHGEGSVDFAEIFRHMERDGFQGTIALELAPDFSGKTSLIQKVKEGLEYLRSR